MSLLGGRWLLGEFDADTLTLCLDSVAAIYTLVLVASDSRCADEVHRLDTVYWDPGCAYYETLLSANEGARFAFKIVSQPTPGSRGLLNLLFHVENDPNGCQSVREQCLNNWGRLKS